MDELRNNARYGVVSKIMLGCLLWQPIRYTVCLLPTSLEWLPYRNY